VFLVLMRGVASRVNDDRQHQHIDALGTGTVSALDQHGLRAAIAAAARPAPTSRLRSRAIGASSSRRFRQVRRDDKRARMSTRLSTSIACGLSSRSPEVATITGSSTTLGRQRRARPRPPRSPPAATACRSSPRDVEIGEHRVDLRVHELRRHVVDAGHALGVLRGQRGDDERAVDAERGEGLEVGLDAGAAARIGPAW
jgi:hypothetical protein